MARGFHQPETGGGPLGSKVELAPGVVVDADVLRWAFARSGGPGGQNVNKVSSKAELRITLGDLPLAHAVVVRLCGLWPRAIVGVGEPVIDEVAETAGPGVPPTAVMRPSFDPRAELQLVSQTDRSQSGNKAECLARLRQLIIQAMVKPKTRRKTKPSYGAKQRRLADKKRDGSIKKRRRAGGEE